MADWWDDGFEGHLGGDWANDSFNVFAADMEGLEGDWANDSFNVEGMEDPVEEPAQEPAEEPVEEPIVGGSVDILDVIDFSKLFHLTQLSKKVMGKMNITKSVYNVDIEPLPRKFDNANSLRILPRVFEEILKIITVDFEPEDRLSIALDSRDLDSPFYLNVKKFKDFCVEDLMKKVELLNSQKKFKIDESFTIMINRFQPPSGGAKRKNVFEGPEVRKRWAQSIVSVKVYLFLELT
jgi:hypothetical protein